jgi:hypothetical protein
MRLHTCFCPSLSTQLVPIPHTNIVFLSLFLSFPIFTIIPLLFLPLSHPHPDPCPSSDGIVTPTLTKLTPTITIPTLTMTFACVPFAQQRQPLPSPSLLSNVPGADDQPDLHVQIFFDPSRRSTRTMRKHALLYRMCLLFKLQGKEEMYTSTCR